MSDTMITPEDRERLAKSKFLEWLDEGLDDERISKKLGERFTAKEQQQQEGQQQPPQQQQQQQQPPQRRRSLLETCLSDTFGF